MQFEKKFSGYIGFSPISLFITLEDEDYHLTSSLPFCFKSIQSYEVKDLIFQGAVLRNLDFLQWLSARLIAEEYNISLVLDCKELQTLKETTVYAHRLTLMIGQLPTKLAETLEQLGESDIIILNTNSPLQLHKLATTMEAIGCEASLYFNTELLDESKVLKAGITKAYPFGGLNAPKESTNEIGTADRIGVHQEKS